MTWIRPITVAGELEPIEARHPPLQLKKSVYLIALKDFESLIHSIIRLIHTILKKMERPTDAVGRFILSKWTQRTEYATIGLWGW